jgi:hypothetical protein
MDEISHLKLLAHVFAAQGRLAETDQHPRQAAQAYVDVIRLGHHSERGGTLIDSMVGVAIEALGTSALEKLYSQLNAEECREIALALEAIERDRETIESIRAQERAWARRTFGFKGQIARLFTFKQLKAAEQRWAARRKAQEIRSQQLLKKLSNRTHELDKDVVQ